MGANVNVGCMTFAKSTHHACMKHARWLIVPFSTDLQIAPIRRHLNTICQQGGAVTRSVPSQTCPGSACLTRPLHLQTLLPQEYHELACKAVRFPALFLFILSDHPPASQPSGSPRTPFLCTCRFCCARRCPESSPWLGLPAGGRRVRAVLRHDREVFCW